MEMIITVAQEELQMIFNQFYRFVLGFRIPLRPDLSLNLNQKMQD